MDLCPTACPKKKYLCLSTYTTRVCMYISDSVVRKILKEAGAARVSEEACTEFQKRLNKLAFDAASKAVRLSKHAKRKTVEASDIKLAYGSE